MKDDSVLFIFGFVIGAIFVGIAWHINVKLTEDDAIKHHAGHWAITNNTDKVWYWTGKDDK